MVGRGGRGGQNTQKGSVMPFMDDPYRNLPSSTPISVANVKAIFLRRTVTFNFCPGRYEVHLTISVLSPSLTLRTSQRQLLTMEK